LSLSLDTPLAKGTRYTFHMRNTGNGVYAETAGQLQDSISDLPLANVSVAVTGPVGTLLGVSGYDIVFDYNGGGDTVQSLADQINTRNSNVFASSVVFDSADTGIISNADGITKYILIAAAIVLAMVFVFGFAKGFGGAAEGSAASAVA
jgi:hypothetical protein